ncbi:Vacuolar protein sorting-associated protein ist1 [Polyrhizophydium stewartii]|uniref:Vacuolar protein sorting-associated protein ist1 n=1 Tax=Polyrhizophydium stewartii TaxID=2732419 RepID=A0ABR4MWW8_9FUNG
MPLRSVLFNASKTKVQLKVAINRLRLVQQKKQSINQQARKEIADLLQKGKEDSARVRVEHIIREDFNIEALELIELFAETLLARFGLIESQSHCDPAIAEAVNTIIYAAPRIEIKELDFVREQLANKYGSEFVTSAMQNFGYKVNDRVVQKLKAQRPERSLVNQYLKAIAGAYNVDWEPPVEELPELDDIPSLPPALQMQYPKSPSPEPVELKSTPQSQPSHQQQQQQQQQQQPSSSVPLIAPLPAPQAVHNATSFFQAPLVAPGLDASSAYSQPQHYVQQPPPDILDLLSQPAQHPPGTQSFTGASARTATFVQRQAAHPYYQQPLPGAGSQLVERPSEALQHAASLASAPSPPRSRSAKDSADGASGDASATKDSEPDFDELARRFEALKKKK